MTVYHKEKCTWELLKLPQSRNCYLGEITHTTLLVKVIGAHCQGGQIHWEWHYNGVLLWIEVLIPAMGWQMVILGSLDVRLTTHTNLNALRAGTKIGFKSRATHTHAHT